MDWGTIAATCAGAAIAFSGTMLSDVIHSRRSRASQEEDRRREAAVEFLLALRRANSLLHAAAQADHQDQRMRAASVQKAMEDAGVYGAREHLLLTGSENLLVTAEAAFRVVLVVRDAVARGVALRWPNFRPSDDALSEAVWNLRQAVRSEFGQKAMDVAKLVEVPDPDISARLNPEASPGSSEI